MSEPDISLEQSSPVLEFRSFTKGWNGYWADPFGEFILREGHKFWLEILRLGFLELPRVLPSADNTTEFVWSKDYPARELSILLWDDSNQEIEFEYLLRLGKENREGSTFDLKKALEIIGEYFTFHP